MPESTHPIQPVEDNASTANPLANQPDPAIPAPDASGGTAPQAEPPKDTPQAKNILDAFKTEKETAASAANAPKDPLDLPVTDWTKVDLGLPENAADAGLVAAFGEQAQQLGLSPRQMAALAQWQVNAIQAAREKSIEEGITALSREWGAKAAANQQAALALVSNVDRALGNNSFSQALERTGAACDQDFVRGLFAIAKMLGEDSLGTRAGAGDIDRPETPLEALTQIFGPKR